MNKTNSTNTNNTNDYCGCPPIKVRGDSIKTGEIQSPSIGWKSPSIGRNELPNLSFPKKPINHPHYDNKNGSLYKIASDLNLNAYEFDILKRIARCRKKGQFKEDLQKIKDTVDLYLKEYKQ